MSTHAPDTHHEHDGLDDHDLGLSHDLPRISARQGLGRRRLLAAFGGVGAAAALAACGTDSTTSTLDVGDRPSGGPGGAPPAGMGGDSVEVADGEIPEETAGPYPGDGSNGVNVLAESGIVRSDITGSFGDASGVADGVPVTVRMRVYDLSGEDVTPLEGAAIYFWHCDAQGGYSEKHLPLPGDKQYTLTARDRDEVFTAENQVDGNGVASPAAGKDRLRARLSGSMFGYNVQKPTAAEITDAHHHADHEAEHDAPVIGHSADGHQFDGRHQVEGEVLTHKH